MHSIGFGFVLWSNPFSWWSIPARVDSVFQ